MPKICQLNAYHFAPPEGKKVIKAIQYRQMIDAENIIKAAHEKAKKITKKAESDYEKAKNKGYQDGLEAFEQEKIECAFDLIQKAILYSHRIENKLVDIVRHAVSKITDLIDKDQYAAKTIAQSMNDYRNVPDLSVRVAIANHPQICKHLQKISSTYADFPLLDIKKDEKLNPGDCILESPLGIVDLGFDQKMVKLDRAMEKMKHDDFSIASLSRKREAGPKKKEDR